MNIKDNFKRIDVYLIRKFLGTFFYCIILIMAIVVVFDFNEKLDKFIQNDAPWHTVLINYYLNFIPYFSVKFSPLFIFISVIFFTSKLASNSEIIAMLSSGLSFRRIVMPYMMSAAFLAALMFTMNSFIVPKANKVRLDFEDRYVRKVKSDYSRNVQLEISPGDVMYIERYNTGMGIGDNFFLDSYNQQHLVSRLTAKKIVRKENHRWLLQDYVIRKFKGINENISQGARLDTVIDVDPDEFDIVKGWSEQLTTPELNKYLNKQKERGVADIKEYEVEYYRRFSFPFSCFILTLIGVSLASRKVRGGMGLHLGLGLLISFTYILLDTVSGSFAIGSGIPPVLAVWSPNIIYTLIGLLLYKKAPK